MAKQSKVSKPTLLSVQPDQQAGDGFFIVKIGIPSHDPRFVHDVILRGISHSRLLSLMAQIEKISLTLPEHESYEVSLLLRDLDKMMPRGQSK